MNNNNNNNNKSNNNPAPKGAEPGLNLQVLGLKSPMEVIDILALIKVDGQPIIKDDKAFLDPRLKAKLVMEYFHANYGVNPNDLPYVACLVKRKIKKDASD